MACFRDKISTNTEQLAFLFVDICKKYNIHTILINQNISLAIKTDANGVHLTSNQFDEIVYAKANNLFTIISCHTIEEIQRAKLLGADGVTYSPIFYSPNKGNTIGTNALIKAKEQIKDFIIIGLGGIISKEQINSIKESNADGFASIRYFI